MEDEADFPHESRNRSGYSSVHRDPLLPDVEPEQHTSARKSCEVGYEEIKIPIKSRERSHSTASNISEYGKDLAHTVETPLVMGYNILILLFTVGIITSTVSGCTQWANQMISLAQAKVLESSAAGPFLLMLTTTGFCGLSAAMVWKGNRPAVIGPGMPEVKAVLANDFHRSDFPAILSFKIAYIRLFSLILAVGAGMSTGIGAPLMHVAVCISFVLMDIIPDYHEFLENHAVRKQIFTAAAAVGMSTVFNAPIGGLLMTIELTSTFYLTSNYWRSFMVATTGAVMYSVLLLARGEKVVRIYSVPVVEDPFMEWEFIMFAALGTLFGILGILYLKMHQAFFLYVKPYTLKYPVSTAAAAGTLTALLIYAAGAHSAKGVSESIILHDVYLDCHISQMDSRTAVSPLGGLLGSLVVRVALTLLGTTMRISSGVFLPMLTIGGLGGRIFGQILAYICSDATHIYVAGYAMVGAVSFTSATLQSISVAVIVIEQTGQFSMLLPCLLGAIIACGISKARTLSLFDQGMVNKGLESFELLLKESTGHRYAADVLDEKVISVHEQCSVQDLFTLLGNLRQTTFPVTSNSGRLVGSIERFDVFTFLKSVFEKDNLYNYLRQHVPADVHVEDRRLERLHLIETRNALLRGQGLHLKNDKDHQEYDEEGYPLSRFRGVFGILSRSAPGHHYSADQYAQDESFHSERSEGGTGFGEDGSAPVDDGNHRGPTAVNPLHQQELSSVQPPPPPPLSTPSPGRAVNKTPFAPGSPGSGHSPGSSWHSASPLDNLDNIVKRFSNRIASFGLSASGHSDTPLDGNNNYVMDAISQLRLNNLLAQGVDLSQEPLLPINGFPFTAHRHTTMDQLYVLFEMVKVQCVFVVTNSKRLEGMISKHLLMQSLKKKSN